MHQLGPISTSLALDDARRASLAKSNTLVTHAWTGQAVDMTLLYRCIIVALAEGTTPCWQFLVALHPTLPSLKWEQFQRKPVRLTFSHETLQEHAFHLNNLLIATLHVLKYTFRQDLPHCCLDLPHCCPWKKTHFA